MKLWQDTGKNVWQDCKVGGFEIPWAGTKVAMLEEVVT
jgi:hypothetical protein